MNEIESFVLGYLQLTGSVVEPAGDRVYEVLLPDDTAQQWRVPSHLQLGFGDSDSAPGLVRLGYNHPLVERMIEGATAAPVATCYYINNLRLNKTGLSDLAKNSWVLPNSRVVALPGESVARVRNTYIRFNFKAALISDEKQERLVSVLMNAHSGAPAADPALIERLAIAREPDTMFRTLPDGPMRWTVADNTPAAGPLAPVTLQALLEKARQAVLDALAEPLQQLQRRTHRFRQLDEARLNEYYDDIERDLRHRLGTASPARRETLEEKLSIMAAERVAKLADLTDRYRARLDLTLLNLLVIVQPNLVEAVRLENRTTRAGVYAVYDPLLHRLEPLVCGVCGRPAQRTFLCHNGHLAHENCLAPACVDCKRVFCAQCTGEVGHCDVCQQPLCRHSRLSCAECGRGTCRAHVRMCHANHGRPVELAVSIAVVEQPKPQPVAAPRPPSSPTAAARPVPKKPAKATPAAKNAAARRAGQPKALHGQLKGLAKPQRMEVVVYENAVCAYLLASRERQLAWRAWELAPEEGIVITCNCELGPACPANQTVMRPVDAGAVEKQLLDEIGQFRREYGLPAKKVIHNRSVGQQIVPAGRFMLHGAWRAAGVLAQAQASFDRRYRPAPTQSGRR